MVSKKQEGHHNFQKDNNFNKKTFEKFFKGFFILLDYMVHFL